MKFKKQKGYKENEEDSNRLLGIGQYENEILLVLIE
jgi:hypothetical protein